MGRAHLPTAPRIASRVLPKRALRSGSPIRVRPGQSPSSTDMDTIPWQEWCTRPDRFPSGSAWKSPEDPSRTFLHLPWLLCNDTNTKEHNKKTSAMHTSVVMFATVKIHMCTPQWKTPATGQTVMHTSFRISSSSTAHTHHLLRHTLLHNEINPLFQDPNAQFSTTAPKRGRPCFKKLSKRQTQ